MPANLTPEYIAADKAYKEAKTDEERLSCLERMLATIPKHKGTEKMQADIKRRISKLKERLEEAKKQKKKGHSFSIEREGAGQVALIGPPNAGKSALLRCLTKAPVEVADYPFTTKVPVPGMMPYKDIHLQLVDLPPLCIEHTEPWVIEIARGCDVLAIVLDVSADDLLERLDFIFQRLDKAKIALIGQDNEQPPWPYVGRPALIIANKIDVAGATVNLEILQEYLKGKYELLPISAIDSNYDFTPLKDALFRALRIIRVYAKQPGKPPDMSQPFTLKQGSTVLDLAGEIHKDFAANFNYARIWGSTRFEGQTVQRDYVLQDGDIVEIHIHKRPVNNK